MSTVFTIKNHCCNQNKFVHATPYCYGPLGAGTGYNGQCAVCGKDWEIDTSTIAEVQHDFAIKEVATNIISSDLTVGKLINILEQFDANTPIDSIRLKGAENIVYAETTEDGLSMID